MLQDSTTSCKTVFFFSDLMIRWWNSIMIPCNFFFRLKSKGCDTEGGWGIQFPACIRCLRYILGNNCMNKTPLVEHIYSATPHQCECFHLLIICVRHCTSLYNPYCYPYKMIVKDMCPVFSFPLDASVHFVDQPCCYCCCWWRASFPGPLPASTLPRRLPVYVMTLDVYERERRDPSLLLPLSERSLVLPRDLFTAQSRFIDPAAAHTAKVRWDYTRKNAPIPTLYIRLKLPDVKWHVCWPKRTSKEEYLSLLTVARQRVQPLSLPPPWCVLTSGAIKTRNNKTVRCLSPTSGKKPNQRSF